MDVMKKTKEINSSYSSSPHTIHSHTSTHPNVPNTNLSVLNDPFGTDSTTSSSNDINNAKQ